ncbi:unnamed protein product, partial [Hapterophycus canaliculatus]
MSEIDDDIILTHYQQRKQEQYKPTTLTDEFRIIRAIMKRASKKHKCPSLDEITFPEIKKGEGRQRILSNDEIQRIRDQITDINKRDFFDVLWMLGIRYMDAARLTYQNLDLTTSEIVVKHRKSKQVFT